MLSTLGQGGGGGITMQQVIQIAVFALIFGGSALSWLFRKLAEKSKQRDQTMQQQRQTEETLRTGRFENGRAQAATQAAPLPTSTDEARRRLQEIATKRRAQLERAARGEPSPASAPAPAAPPSRSPVPPPARARPLKPAKRDPSRSEQSRPPTKPQPQAQREAMPELQRNLPRERTQAQDNAGRAAERQHQAQRAEAKRQLIEGQEPSARERAVAAAGLQPVMGQPDPAAAPIAELRGLLGETLSGDGNQWRRAVVMAELLKRPLCERNFDEP